MEKNPPNNAGDPRDGGSIPGLGRSPVVVNGNLLQYSCLENSMDRGGWRATVHGITESDMTEHANRQAMYRVGAYWKIQMNVLANPVLYSIS